MKKILLFAILNIWFLVLSAQVIVSTPIIPAGLVQKSQLWNLILINNSQEVMSVSIKLIIQDSKTGTSLMSASTGNVQLTKGSVSFTEKDFSPIYYNYYSSAFDKPYFPMGHYVICYQVSDMKLGELKVIGEECVPFSIEPLSPPLLHMPDNGSTITELNPNFSWMPPAPATMFDNLKYEILLTEVYSGQQPIEAIQNNSPIYFKTGLLNNSEWYPSAYAKLDTGKIYAWMVVARNDLDYAANSEVWTFTIGAATNINPDNKGDYFVLDKKLKSTFILRNSILRVKYYSYDFPYNTTIHLLDPNNKIVFKWDKEIKNGENYMEFPLSKKLKREVEYTLKLKVPSGNSIDLKFMLN